VSAADEIAVGLKWLDHGKGLPLPRRQSAGAAGFDLIAALDIDNDVAIAPGMRALVPCGFCMQLPDGYEAQVRPRSGLAAKFGVTVLNAPGTIDADYRGEVQVILINHGDRPFPVRRGDRIAQMVIAPVTFAQFVAREALDATERGVGGFGSTGHASR
jgi:dUTP pyrophosphatase